MKKLTLLSFCVLFSAAIANAQDAIVQQLTPVEAKQAKQLYQVKQDAEKAWVDFNAKLKTKYTSKDWDATSFKFSKDFRFIVPDGYVLTNSGSASGNILTLPNGQGITWSPAGQCNSQGVCW